MSERDQILSIFRSTEALLDGHFVLTSGRHSASYFQCAKVLQHPEYLTAFSIMIADEFEKQMIKSNLNEITDPFLSQFGWHILEVLGTRVEDKTNENIQDRAFSYLFNRKFQEELETDLQELRADAFVEIKEFD